MPINVYNFSAGPATLPKSVIDQITDRLEQLHRRDVYYGNQS